MKHRSEFDSLYGGKYLKAEDIDEDFTSKIVDVTTEAFENGSKAVLSLEGEDRRLVVNKTNAESLRAVFGKNLRDWIGKSIDVRRERAIFAGKSVPALRVYPTRRGAPPTRAVPAGSSAAEPNGELPPFSAYEDDLV